MTGIKFQIALCSIEVLSLFFLSYRSQVWEGGPLFDFSGSFVGMNLFSSMEGSFFMPSNIIIEWLENLRTSQKRNAFLSWVKYLNMVRYVFKCKLVCLFFSLLIYSQLSLCPLLHEIRWIGQTMYEAQWIYNILKC